VKHIKVTQLEAHALRMHPGGWDLWNPGGTPPAAVEEVYTNLADLAPEEAHPNPDVELPPNKIPVGPRGRWRITVEFEPDPQ
jgi:hypothetical protein